MKRLISLKLSTLVVLASAFASATQGADSAPNVDTILQKFVTAVGGKAALEKLTTVVISGKIESPILSGPAGWRFYSKQPDKQLVEVEIPGFGLSVDGFDGKVAWSKSQSGGLREKTGEELEKAKRDAQFSRELNFKKIYPNLTYKGKEKVAGEDAHLIQSTPSAKSKERFAFSEKSGLLLRQESEFESPQGTTSATALLSDYRPVNGVNYAHSINLAVKVGGQEMNLTLKLDAIQQNTKIDDAKFGKPSS